MLAKLFKHELKATSKVLVPVFLIAFIFTIVNRIILGFDIFHGVFTFIPALTLVGYVVSLIAVVVVTFVVLIIRFYKNLTSEEGYLMFTLPAKVSQLINSKLLAALLWTVLSFLAVILSLLVMYLRLNDFASIIDALQRGWTEINRAFGAKTILFIIDVIIMAILSIISNILSIYVSIAIGQLFHGHRLLASFGAYIGINIALQMFLVIATAVTGLLLPENINDTALLPTIIFPCIIVFYIFLNLLYYWVTNYLFSYKLNLE